MMLRSPAILLGLGLSFSSPLVAQEIIKPGPVATTSDQLPKRPSITAAQLPDGRIRVVWSAVPDAATYKLYRSVPPEGIKGVALPNPADTVYIDGDVKVGTTYYYMVDAPKGAGIEGLKISSAPVTAGEVDTTDSYHIHQAWPKKISG